LINVTTRSPLNIKPVRRLRRWWLRTPTDEAASAIMGSGILLIVSSAALYLLAVKYG
jgi:hypothetical protein